MDPHKEVSIAMMWGWNGYGYYGYNGIGWMLGVIVMLLILGGLVALAVWAITSIINRQSGTNGGENILRRRLAAGEITQKEYERLRHVLHDQP